MVRPFAVFFPDPYRQVQSAADRMGFTDEADTVAKAACTHLVPVRRSMSVLASAKELTVSNYDFAGTPSRVAGTIMSIETKQAKQLVLGQSGRQVE